MAGWFLEAFLSACTNFQIHRIMSAVNAVLRKGLTITHIQHWFSALESFNVLLTRYFTSASLFSLTFKHCEIVCRSSFLQIGAPLHLQNVLFCLLSLQLFHFSISDCDGLVLPFWDKFKMKMLNCLSLNILYVFFALLWIKSASVTFADHSFQFLFTFCKFFHSWSITSCRDESVRLRRLYINRRAQEERNIKLQRWEKKRSICLLPSHDFYLRPVASWDSWSTNRSFVSRQSLRNKCIQECIKC